MTDVLADRTITLSCANPVIGEHRVHGRPVFPGLAYFDLIYQICLQRGLAFERHGVETLRIQRPLMLEDSTTRLPVRVRLEQREAGRYTAIIEDADASARPYAIAELARIPPVTFPAQENLPEAAPASGRAARSVGFDALYRQCQAAALAHGDYMRAQGTVAIDERGLVASPRLAPQASAHAERFLFHPVVLDSAAVASQALTLDGDIGAVAGADLYLPLLFQNFRAAARISAGAVARIKAETAQAHGELLTFALEFFTAEGKKIAEIARFTAKRVRDPEIFRRPARDEEEVRSASAPLRSAEIAVDPQAAAVGLRNMIAAKLGVSASEVALDKGYYELGLDSGDLLDLVANASQALGVELSPTLLFEHTTLAELGAFFQRAAGATPPQRSARRPSAATPDGAQRCRFRFHEQEAFLQDHLVLGKPALMGVAHPCLVVEASLRCEGEACFPLALDNIRMEGGPVTLEAGEEVELSVVFAGDEAEAGPRSSFNVRFRKTGQASERLCCRGFLRTRAPFEASRVDIAALLAGLEPLAASDIAQWYRRIPQFAVGPMLRTISQAWTDGESVLVSKVDLPCEAKGGHARYGFDPLLLNSCFFFRDPAFGETQASMHIPLMIERIVVAKPTPTSVYLVNRLRASKAGYAAFDVDILSPDGELLGRVVNASVREVKDPQALANADFSQPEPRPIAAPAADQIAIIGLAGRYPDAETLDQFWANLSNGVDSIKEIPAHRWDHARYFDPDKDKPGKTYSKWGGFLDGVDEFDPFYFSITPREAQVMDPQERLFLQCAAHALEDAGYTRKSLLESAPDHSGKSASVGVYVGVMYQEYQLYGAEQTLLGNPSALSGSASSIANRVSYAGDFSGPSMAIDTMCSSSLTAVHLACRALERGDCAYALAGGVNLSLHPNKYLMLGQGRFVSSRGRCEAFGQGGDGYVPGEGVGAVLLKPLARAEADGDHIYAVIKACEINHGGKSAGYAVPGVKAQADIIARTYARAGLDPRRLSYIEAHGTGTALGDPIEIAALSSAFRAFTSDRQFCAIGSVKSNIGHCESAAGIAGITKVLLQMKHRRLAPSLHSATLNPGIDFASSPFVVQQALTDWPSFDENGVERPRLAGLSSFGAGGSNAHVVLEEYRPAEDRRVAPTRPAMIPLSAASAEQLRRLVESLAEHLQRALQSTPDHDDRMRLLGDIEFTLQQGREPHARRLGLLASSVTDLSDKLALVLASDDFDAPTAALWEAQDVFIGDMKAGAGRGLAPLTEADAALLLAAWIEQDRFRDVLRFWSRGGAVDWSRTRKRPIAARRVSLPGYPFARERYWFDAAPTTFGEVSAARAAHPASLSNAEVALTRLADALHEIAGVPADRLDASSDFEALGLDSVMITKLNQRIAAWTGETDATLFYKHKTLEELAGHLAERLAPTPVELHPRSQVALPAPAFVAAERPAASDLPEDAIAIIGMSGRYPKAETLEAFWDNLLRGLDCVTEIPPERFDYRAIYRPGLKGRTDSIYCKWGGFLGDVSQFDAPFFNLSAQDAALMDPQERLFLEAAWNCLESAGSLPPRFQAAPRNFGVFAGVSFNAYQLLGADALKDRAPFYPAGSQTFSVANRVSFFFNFTGPSLTVDTACSSSLYAVHLACESLRNGETDAALAGGVNLTIHPSKHLTLCASGFAASDGRCRAFASGGDGYVPGEGVGVALLKRHADAVRDGDRILALIRGTGVSHDGKTQGFTVPNPVSQTQAIRRALDRSGVPPETIAYIEAHGTGTALGDPIEIRGLADAYPPLPNGALRALGSVKASIGHGEACAGIAQLAKVVLQLEHGLLAPTLLHGPLNPDIPFEKTGFHVPTTPVPWPVLQTGDGSEAPRRAAISSFGAGGVNVHVIVEQASEAPKTPVVDDAREVVLVLSAQAVSQLPEQACRFLAFLESEVGADYALAEIAFTQQHRRPAFRYRLALVTRDRLDARRQLLAWLDDPRMVAERGPYSGDSLDRAQRNAEEPSTDDLHGLARAWVCGGAAQWPAAEGSGAHRIAPLPTYPFLTKRCWITDVVTPMGEPATSKGMAAPDDDLDDWLMRCSWEPTGPAPDEAPSGRAVVVCEEGSQLDRLRSAWPGLTSLVSREGAAARADIDEAMRGAADGVLVFLQPFSSIENMSGPALEALFQRRAELLTGLVNTALELARAGRRPKLALLNLIEGGSADPVQEALSQYFSFLRYEAPEVGSLIVDTDALDEPTLQRIRGELHCRQAEPRIRYQDGIRLSQKLAPLPIREHGPPSAFDSSGAMLVTGGFGGVGVSVMRWLIDKGVKSLIVVGRKPLSSPLRHPSLPRDATIASVIARWAQEHGARLNYIQSDLSDEAALSRELARVRGALGEPITGVFHLAGVTTEAIPIHDTGAPLLCDIARPKLTGAHILDCVTRDDPLRYFCLFSSISAVEGMQGAGLSAYSASNAALLALAASRRSHGRPAQAIQWTDWDGAGMAVAHDHRAFFDALGMRMLKPEQGVAFLERILASGLDQCIVFNADWPKFASINRAVRLLPVFSHYAARLGVDVPPAAAKINPEARARTTAEATDLLALLLAELTKLLGQDDIHPDQTFTEIGLDSVNSLSFFSNLSDRLSFPVMPSVIFRYPTVSALADYLSSQCGASGPPAAATPGSARAAPACAPPAAAENDSGVAIVGMACQFPMVDDLPEFWTRLCEGFDGVAHFPRARLRLLGLDEAFTDRELESIFGGYLDGVDQFAPSLFNISPREARFIDPQQRLLMMAAHRAILDAGVRDHPSFARTGVFMAQYASEYMQFAEEYDKNNALFIATGNAGSIAANRLSYHYGFKGPSLVLDTACSSTLAAIDIACQYLRSEQIDFALVGGVSLNLNPRLTRLLQDSGMLSPSGKCQTFDAKADGYVPGEGVGVIVLQRHAEALERRARSPETRIYARIAGSAVNQDGKSNGMTAPNGLAQEEVIRAAFTRARLSPADAGFIETHGTGTYLGDPVEIEALGAVVNAGRAVDNPCVLGCLKTNIGHLEPAAGIAGVIKAALCLHLGKIPGNNNLNVLNPLLKSTVPAFRFPDHPLDWEGTGRIAGVSSFGFGGVNGHVVLTSVDEPADAGRSGPELARRLAETYPPLGAELKSYWLRRAAPTGAGAPNEATRRGRPFMPLERQPSATEALRVGLALTPDEPGLMDTGNFHVGFYLDVTYRVLATYFGETRVTVDRFEFQAPLLVSSNAPTHIQVVVEQPAEGRYELIFYYRTGEAGASGPQTWTRTASAQARSGADAEDELDSHLAALLQAPGVAGRIMDEAAFYERYTEMGFPAQGRVKAIRRCHMHDRFSVASLRLDFTGEDYGLGAHPGFLDAALQPAILMADGDGRVPYMTTAMEGVRLFGPLQVDEEYRLVSFLRPQPAERGVDNGPRRFSASWAIVDSRGQSRIVCALTDLQRLAQTDRALSESLKARLETDQTPAGDKLLMLVAELLDCSIEDIDRDKALLELGMDSLMLMKLQKAMDHLNLAISGLFKMTLRELLAQLPSTQRDEERREMAERLASQSEDLHPPFTNLKPWSRTRDAWLRGRRRADAAVRLYCFPYAHMSTAVFKGWQALLPEHMDVCPIELPGRGDRMRERPLQDMWTLASILTDLAGDELDRPFAIYGHSAGALMGYVWCLHLQASGKPTPGHLFAAAFSAPGDEFNPVIGDLLTVYREHGLERLPRLDDICAPDAGPRIVRIIDALERSMNEAGLFNFSRELIHAQLPALIATFEMVEAFGSGARDLLQTPISGLHGANDIQVLERDVQAWRALSRGAFTFKRFEGNHLFMDADQSMRPVVAYVRDVLDALIEEDGAPNRDTTRAPLLARANGVVSPA